MKRVFAFIGFTVAITLIVLNIISFNYVSLIILIAMVLFAASLLIKMTRQAKVLPIVLGSVIFACLIFMLVNLSAVMPVRSLDKCSAESQFRIVDIPKYNVSSDSYIYVIKTKSINHNGAPQEIKLKIKTHDEIDADYYDLISGKLSFYSKTDKAFDSYGDYDDGIYMYAELESIDCVDDTVTKPVNYYLILMREYIADVICAQFRGDTAGISIALLTGDKSYLSQQFRENIKICGFSHFFAVSGFHISIISLGLYSVLKLLKCPKLLNTIISISVMVLYCGIADFSKSAIRACIMLAVMLLSRLVNSKADSLNSLGLAVFLICFNPFAVTDVGAVLTVSAMLGILVIYHSYHKNAGYNNKLFEKSDKSSLFSLSVLIAIIPAMYVFFGSVSIGSVPSNIIIEPIIIILMITVILFCSVSKITFLAFIPKFIIDCFSKLLIRIVDFVSDDYSFILVNISGAVFGVAIAAVFVFIGVCLIVNKKISLKITAVFIAVVMIIASAGSWYQQSVSAFVHISESGMVVIYDRDNAVIVGMDSRYDKNKADSIVSNKKTVYISCESYVDDIDINARYYQVLSESMSVSVENGIIIVRLLDKTFKIDDSCVIINENVFKRDLYYGSADNTSVTISFVENSPLYIRRGDSG